MTIEITISGDLRLDQTAGVQSGGTPDKDDIALATNLDALPDPFETFLESLGLTDAQKQNAATYGGAQEDPGAGFLVNVAGDGVTDLFFSQADGTLFNGQVATYNGQNLTVAGSTDPIYLYSFAGGDILIASTEAPTGVNDANGVPVATNLDASKIVFAYYLDENMTHTGADVWGVTFQPIEHFVDGTTEAAHDDAVDLGDFLHVSATGSVSFDFDNLRSGNFLWVALGTESAGLLMTGRDLNVHEIGTKPSSKVGEIDTGGATKSDSINTSQGGIGATTGINNQMYTPGNVGVMTFVTGLDPLPTGASGEASGTNVQDIDYSGYINVTTAGIFISQTQGGGTASMTIGLYEAGGGTAPEEGFDYIGAENGNDNTSGAFEDDTEVDIVTVEVKIGSTVVGTWTSANSGTTTDGVTVTISGHEASVSGLSAGMEVFLNSASGDTFNRLQVSANEGTTPFDIGRVDLSQAVGDTQNIGDSVFIHDDGVAVTVDDTSGTFAAGAQGSWEDLVGTDGFGSMNVTLNSYAIAGGTPVVVNAALTQTDTYAFEGSITADLTDDGIANPEKLDFTLIFDPENDTYDFQIDEPETTTREFDTSQGTLKAGGPDAVRTLLFGGDGEDGNDDIVFFAAKATATATNPDAAVNSILDLIGDGELDLTETQIENLLPLPNLIAGAQMNVSTSGIGVNSNNLTGADEGEGTGAFAGTSITDNDQSFVINPETVVDKVTVYIAGSTGGYAPDDLNHPEELYYIVYYTDGTSSAPRLVESGDLTHIAQNDKSFIKEVRGGDFFVIDDGKEIDAVQLTMGVGQVKIPLIGFSVTETFDPQPLQLNLTAELFDGDGDSQTDSFSIDLDATV